VSFSSEPCADHTISAAARRVILTGGGGAPIDLFGGGGVRRRGSSFRYFQHAPQMNAQRNGTAVALY